MGVILDTNAVSAALAEDELLRQVLVPFGRPSLPLPVIGEYRFGLRGSSKAGELSPLFRELVENSVVLYPDLDTTEHYATIRHELKTKGRPIQRTTYGSRPWFGSINCRSSAVTPISTTLMASNG